MERAHDAGAGERLRGAMLASHGHEAGHFMLGQFDLVITSYSIHYTKLYDLLRFRPARLSGQTAFVFFNHFFAVASGHNQALAYGQIRNNFV